MLEHTLPLTGFLKPYLSHLVISAFVWLTYHYTIKHSGFVSDDIQGLAEYDGKLQGWEYGMLWRWVRFHIVGGLFPSGQKNPDGSEVMQGKLPSRAHFLSVLVFNISAILAYEALHPIVGQAISLMAVLILVVHPCTTQGVAWVSGMAYSLSLVWISLQVILCQWFYANKSLESAIWVIPVFCLIQFFAIHAIFATTAMTCILLWYLGYWHFAILGALVSGVMCFDQIYKTVKLRKDEFKKQHMEASTILNFGKPVVAMKTLYYYLKHSVFPIRMGLYHEWGFHYEKGLERRDGMFWLGFLSFSALVFIAVKTPHTAIQLGILWYLIFSTGFWNWITAQQFVTERYIMVANLGLGLVIAFITQNHLWAYSFILGCYLCKTWCYLPTYDNELRFYQSNNWNFQKSEVALGNLGVTYARVGLADSAKDCWYMATSINPDYDVPWVNIFYQFRTTGMMMINNGDYQGGLKKLGEAVPFLEKALLSKVCHFPEQWRREHREILNLVKNPSLIMEQELIRLMKVSDDMKSLLMRADSERRVGEITQSINDNRRQMDKLIQFFRINNLVVNNQAVFNRLNSERLLDTITRR